MDDIFFQLVNKPKNENKAANVAINVSVSRNPTYSENLSTNDKQEIREHWESLLLDFYKKHKQGTVRREDFFGYVEKIKESMNSQFLDRFQNDTKGYDNGFRLAHAQKSLSVFLKHLWCMGKMKEPPFCPIDGIILNDVLKKKGAWTKLNDEGTYNKYIEYVDEAVKKSHMSVAEWEYVNWNKVVGARNKKRKVGKKDNNEKKTAKDSTSTKPKRWGPNDIILPQRNINDIPIEWKEITLNGEPFLLFVAERPSKWHFCKLCYKYEDDPIKANAFDINSLSAVQKIIRHYNEKKWYPVQPKAGKTFKYVKFEGNNAESEAKALYNDILSFIEQDTN